MRLLATLAVFAILLTACEGTGGDSEASRRLLQDNLYDYYYGRMRNPADNDPDFTYGWDIDGP